MSSGAGYNQIEPIGGSYNKAKTHKKIKLAIVIATCVLIASAGICGWYVKSSIDSTYSYYKKHLLPTLKYYDLNLNSEPIMHILYKPNNQVNGNSEYSCKENSGYELVTVMNYPGTVAGCLYEGKVKVKRGKCTHSSATEIKATSPINLHNWRAGYFCAKR